MDLKSITSLLWHYMSDPGDVSLFQDRARVGPLSGEPPRMASIAVKG